MKRWLILSMVGCMAFAGAASAAVQQGDTEIDFMGGYMSQNSAGRPNSSDDIGGIDIESLFLAGGIGYFVTDNIQVGAVAMGAWTEIEWDEESGPSDDYDIDIYALGAKGKYHFMPTNQWVPYVGGQVAWSNIDVSGPGSGDDEDLDGILWGPVAGLRYELNAYNDFYIEYQYHIWSGDVDEVVDDGHLLCVGLVHQFK